MLIPGDYEYFVKELLKHKTQPYKMANKELAGDIFARFGEKYPGASIHYYGTQQFICYDDRARRNLVKLLKRQQERQAAALAETTALIDKLTTIVERR